MRAAEDGGDAAAVASACNKAVSVSNAMIMKFIAILRRMNIEFLVSPYEADAQLAYLSKIKIVDVVISEDSDCIPYGCRTILFKWSADGWGSEFKRRSLGANEDLSFVGWTEEMVRSHALHLAQPRFLLILDCSSSNFAFCADAITAHPCRA
jgi:exonuclease 1